VTLDDGKVYRRRVGPDQYLGRVTLDNGKIYTHRVGPDQYVGRVKPDGRLYRHRSVAPDDYLGRVEGMCSLGEGGAAFLLLVLPIVEGIEIEKSEES
jgi:hypothetical protein